MKNKMKAMAVTAVTAGALAVVAPGAGAYAISGGAFTATATSVHTFSVGGAYTIECETSVAEGVATGAATVAMAPAVSGCTFFGFPALITQSGPWDLTAASGSGGVFGLTLSIPAGTTTTMEIPIAGCTVTVAGPQSFPGAGSATNTTPTGVSLQASVSGIAYSASGCPYASGADGQFETNGDVTIPGITIS